MYTGPENEYGKLPEPAATVAVPILLDAGHSPLDAPGSPHRVIAGISPTSPAGSVVLIFCRYCCPSGRARLNVYAVCAPPVAPSLSVLWLSANGSDAAQPVTETPNGSVAV